MANARSRDHRADAARRRPGHVVRRRRRRSARKSRHSEAACASSRSARAPHSSATGGATCARSASAPRPPIGAPRAAARCSQPRRRACRRPTPDAPPAEGGLLGRLRHERAGAGRRRARPRQGGARARSSWSRPTGCTRSRADGLEAARLARARGLGPPAAAHGEPAARDLADGALRRGPDAVRRRAGPVRRLVPGYEAAVTQLDGDRRERPGRDDGARAPSGSAAST